MKVTFLCFLITAFSLNGANALNTELPSAEVKSQQDSTKSEVDLPPSVEGVKPHFILEGNKFWVVEYNKLSDKQYTDDSKIVSYFEKRKSLLKPQNSSDIEMATINYKEGVYVIVEFLKE